MHPSRSLCLHNHCAIRPVQTFTFHDDMMSATCAGQMSESRVAKRKTHTKSRKGCHQCKQRHTKCNEARPRCANCIRLDISCAWPEVPNGSPSSPTASPGTQPSPLGDTHPGTPINNFELSLPDMRLLHHWTTKGYIAVHPSLAKRHDVWQNGIIELGFEHTFLLHGVLALSAVHKASFLLPAERQSLFFQADAHLSQALETMRRNLETSNEETAVPMFVLSAVLLTYNFGSVQEKPEDPVGSLHHCFMLMNGIKVVIGRHWGTIQFSPIIKPLVEMTSASTIQALDELAKDDTHPQVLRLMELTELMLDNQDKEACTLAITQLHRMAVCIPHINPEYDAYHFLFPWAARLSNRFFDLLAAHNPIACVITVYFSALLASVRSVWWFVKWPRWLLTATEQLLVATPDLLEWLDWPQKIIDAAPWTADGGLKMSN
jgi:hypothetical protein